MSLALQLGLDPLRLSWFAGGSSCGKENNSSNPTATINALKFALAHPPTAAPGAGNRGGWQELRGSWQRERGLPCLPRLCCFPIAQPCLLKG